jgi:tetratricopeptide (TPR) repeat protein
MFSGHPILGIGPDNFAAAYPALRTLRAVQLVGVTFLESSPHSWLLQAAVSAGILGAASLTALTAYAAYRALRLVRSSPNAVPLVAGLAAFLTQALFAPNEVALDALFWIALGLIVPLERLAAPAQPAERGTAQVRRPARRGLDALDAIAGVALLAAVALSTTAWTPVRASEAHVAALAHLKAGDTQEALRLARASVDLDGSRAQYWAGLGQVQLTAGQPQSALSSFERAASLAPYLSGHWRNVANARLRLAVSDPSQLPRALDAARRAVVAEPTDPLSYAIVGQILLTQGDREGAIREGMRSIEVHPTEAAFEVIGVAYAQDKRYDEAEKILRRGIEIVGGLTIRTLLAQILIATGRPEDARPILSYVLLQDPTREDAKALYTSLPTPK